MTARIAPILGLMDKHVAGVRGHFGRESQAMRILIVVRGVLVALSALIGVGLQSAHADIGGITLVVYKGGWFIGGSAGHGTLNFHGRSYRLDVGGIDYGFLFGGSRTVLWGRVSNIWRPSDVAGIYGAAGAGLALGGCVRGI